MAVGNNPIDKKILKSLEPLGSLSLDKLDELATKSTIEEMPAGRILFRQGERDKRVIYLLNGQVEVTATGKASGDLIKAKTEDARRPISPTLPRQGTAKTKTNCKVLFIDYSMLDFDDFGPQSLCSCNPCQSASRIVTSDKDDFWFDKRKNDSECSFHSKKFINPFDVIKIGAGVFYNRL